MGSIRSDVVKGMSVTQSVRVGHIATIYVHFLMVHRYSHSISVRSFSSGFIFTTAIPPVVAAGALAFCLSLFVC